MPRLFVAPAAKEDVREISRYIARDNVPASRDWVSSIQHKFRLLAKHPHLGEKRKDLGNDIRVVSHGSYVIYFRLSKPRLEIVRAIRGDRDVKML